MVPSGGVILTDGLVKGHVIILVACLLTSSEAILTKSRYYRRCRENAENNKENRVYTELPDVMQLLLHGAYRNLVLRQIDVDTQFIRPEVAFVIGNTTCPSLMSLKEGPVNECPSYTVLEFDAHRIPQTMTQIKCRCLSCLGPWRDEAKLDICTPLFKYVNVLRSVGVSEAGKRLYAQVWEPVSYKCVCGKLQLSKFKFYMPH